MPKAPKTIKIKDETKPHVRVANRIDRGPYQGPIREDEPTSIRALIMDGVKDYVIIFPERLLERKLAKYGSRIKILQQ